MPWPPGTGPRNIAPDVEQKKIPSLDLVNKVRQVVGKEHWISYPQHVAQLVVLRVFLNLLGVMKQLPIRDIELPERRKMYLPTEGLPGRRLDVSALIVGMFAGIRKVGIKTLPADSSAEPEMV